MWIRRTPDGMSETFWPSQVLKYMLWSGRRMVLLVRVSREGSEKFSSLLRVGGPLLDCTDHFADPHLSLQNSGVIVMLCLYARAYNGLPCPVYASREYIQQGARPDKFANTWQTFEIPLNDARLPILPFIALRT